MKGFSEMVHKLDYTCSLVCYICCYAMHIYYKDIVATVLLNQGAPIYTPQQSPKLQLLQLQVNFLFVRYIGIYYVSQVHSSLGDVYSDLNLTEMAIQELESCIMIREKTRPGADGQLLRGGTHQNLANLYERIGVSLGYSMQSVILFRFGQFSLTFVCFY